MQIRSSITAIISASLIAALACCSKDNSPLQQENPSPYKDLKHKDDVLLNLVLSYESRDTVEYDRLLDKGFVFYFSAYDSTLGSTPGSWRRNEEMAATVNLFGKRQTIFSPPAPFAGKPPYGIDKIELVADDNSWGVVKYYFSSPGPDSVVSIKLDLLYTQGDSAWQSFDPPDSIAPPGEYWFKKRAAYDLVLHTNTQKTIYALNSYSDFEIHFTEFKGDSIWQIARWHDLKH